ncbi:Mis12-Mtw1 protein family-domain-containing protein [Staphylotrichum tortipilum]|uniref:Mis12-Mtw1 protein family-domain-containing protein n=1 Tax=Staphylotrichum tortipilum TaxID=2831512 RepID=A0AAN6MGH6_9PEZI|nr:Mis12-Mtw1 protein family-domain-containing protein [Staphylotrichum longicolle]
MGQPAGGVAARDPPPSVVERDAPSNSNNNADNKSTTAEVSKPLAPPPRPNQQQPGSNSPDYFNNPLAGSLSLEPNPFEQSFGSAPPETPGGTKLPSVAALTSPSSLLPGNTPFAWGGGSLRTGPLSPAMLSGPTNDYFGDTHHIRGGFPTPNESSLRTGLTPGGSGSMFPVPSPNSQAIFSQITGGPAATPGTIDFHRTAVSAAAAKREQAQQQQQQQQQAATSQPVAAPTSQPQEMANGGQAALKAEPNPPTGPFDPHDNDAANGLFMLAQGRNTTQPPPAVQQYPVMPPSQSHTRSTAAAAPASQSVNMSPQTNGAASLTGSSVRGVSEGSAGSDESESARPNTRARGKRNSTSGPAAANARRKADEPPAKAPATKKSRTNGTSGSMSSNEMDMDHSDDDGQDMGGDDVGGSKSKMTDEEKRKNFLERNRVAALKCRQRKKQWLANLQTKVEMFSSENESLTSQITALREEVVNLKTLLLAHKDCPVTQQQGLHPAYMAAPPPMEPFGAGAMGGVPYGMAGPPPVMAGQSMDRRFSYTRHPLQVLSMSNQPERRHSKRLAGTTSSLPLLPSRPLPSSQELEQSQPQSSRARGRKRKDAASDADHPSSSSAAAPPAVFDEQDGDFLFTRGSKRVKTAPIAEEDDEEPAPVVKKSVGRPPKGGARRRASPPPPPEPTPPPPPPPARSRGTAAAAAPAATRRTAKRKSSTDNAPPPEEELVVPKSKTRRKTREPVVEKKPQQRRGAAAQQGNGTGHEEEDDEMEDQQEATPNAHPHSQSQMIALPFSDTPIINRNKEFRKKGGAGAGGRRSSLGMRGRRASSLIENGQSALPHREIDTAEFHKYIAPEGLSEPRRMKQLLIWCGERALSEKPPHGSRGSSAILGARAIQDQLLKDFGARSEFSDWFSREDEPKPPVPVVLQPNPRNVDYDTKIAMLEAKIERLKAEKKAWQSLTTPLPLVPPLYPPSSDPPDPRESPLPNPALLSPSEAAILTALTNPETSFSSFRRQARSRLQNAQAALEFKVDCLADGVHKLGGRVVTANREADVVLALGAKRLKEREGREKKAVGVGAVSLKEVLRSLGRILPPEGG